MTNGIRWVGLDVHAKQSTGAVFDSATGEIRSRSFSGRPHELLGWLCELPGSVRAVYEAGPTGYGLARRARAAGIDMQVCAPGMITRAPCDRVKTDKRDALKLARLHAAGQLTLVHVPQLEHEQMRDLSRCREDIRGDLMRARHRIGKFLLRDTLERAIEEIAACSPWTQIIARLRCMHGIDTLSAFGLCGEVCDFERFAKATSFSAYLGLVPSEHSSGEKRRQGSITKAGSSHARRLLVEAAHQYTRPPRIGGALQRRQEGQEPWVIDLSWRAQRRLHARWRHLKADRGKHGVITAIAVARELAHYCWELALT
jgi:transposase